MSLLGFDAIGRWALGQAPSNGNAALIGASGSYSLTGVAAAFAVKLPAAAGSYAIAGVAVTFSDKLVAAAGGYSLTGVAASFKVKFATNAGAYALTGSAIAEKVQFACAAGSYGITGNATTLGGSLLAVSGSYVVAGSLRVISSGESGLLGFGAIGAGAIGQIGQHYVSDATTFAFNMFAAGGSYAVVPTDTPLIRTGADFDLVYGGIGHYLEELEKQRQLARITRKTPAPIVRTTVPTFKPVGGPPIAPPAPVIDLQAIQNERMEAQRIASAQAATLKRRRQEEELLLLAS